MLQPVTGCKQISFQQIYPLMPCGCGCTVSCLLFKLYSSFPAWNILGLRTSEIMKRQMRELAAAGTINLKQKVKRTRRPAMPKIIGLDNLLERIVEGRESKCTVYVHLYNDKNIMLQWGCKLNTCVSWWGWPGRLKMSGGKLLDRFECLRPLVTWVAKATLPLEGSIFSAHFSTAQMERRKRTGPSVLCTLVGMILFFSCVFC